MPDVVDLLSSSPILPAPRITKGAGVLATSRVESPSKPLSSKAPQRENDGILVLSSDSVDSDIFLPPPKAIPKSACISVVSKTISNKSLKSPQSKNTSGTFNGVFSRSDDFDSTVVLDDDDDPFASDPPPAKKPRLSPSSNPSMSTKGPSFQTWISQLEPTIISEPEAGPSGRAITNLPAHNVGGSSMSPARNTKARLSTIAPKVPSYKKSSSDIGYSSKYAAPRASNSVLKRPSTMGTVFESDPIVFTSSPDPVVEIKKRKEKYAKAKIKQIIVDSSDEEAFNLSLGRDAKGNTTSNVSILTTSERENTLRDFEIDSSDLELPDPAAIPSQCVARTTAKGKEKSKSVATATLARYESQKAKEKKEQEKQRKAKDKLAAKETEKEQKRLAKEEKAREKDRAAELAKVNILRTDKKKSTPEMIVDLPNCLDARLREQIQTFLKPVEAQYTAYDNPQPIIKWRRRIDSEFDKEADHWEKVESYLGREKHVMCIMKAQKFVDLATGDEGKDLDSHVLSLKAKFTRNEIIYLIEGLEPWMRKNKNLQNRKYVQEVRSQISGEAAATIASQNRKKRPQVDHVDEDLVEDMLLKLQVVHGVLIHHTKVPIETAEWVVIFTQHISTVRYRVQKQSLDTNFCMESGQIKTGDGPADTFTKMLQEMVRITAPVAYGIAAEYPTVQKLVKGLKDLGPYALQDCKKTANKDGAYTDKNIGPSISKRVFNVFTCRDEGSYDV